MLQLPSLGLILNTQAVATVIYSASNFPWLWLLQLVIYKLILYRCCNEPIVATLLVQVINYQASTALPSFPSLTGRLLQHISKLGICYLVLSGAGQQHSSIAKVLVFHTLSSIMVMLSRNSIDLSGNI